MDNNHNRNDVIIDGWELINYGSDLLHYRQPLIVRQDGGRTLEGFLDAFFHDVDEVRELSGKGLVESTMVTIRLFGNQSIEEKEEPFYATWSSIDQIGEILDAVRQHYTEQREIGLRHE